MKYCFYLLALMVLCVSAISCTTTATEECCPEEDNTFAQDSLRTSTLSDYIIIEDVIIYRATGAEYIIIEDLVIGREVNNEWIIIEDIYVGVKKGNPNEKMLFSVDKANGTAEHYNDMYVCTAPTLSSFTDYIIIEDVFIGRANGNEVQEEKDFIIIIDIDGI